MTYSHVLLGINTNGKKGYGWSAGNSFSCSAKMASATNLQERPVPVPTDQARIRDARTSWLDKGYFSNFRPQQKTRGGNCDNSLIHGQ